MVESTFLSGSYGLNNSRECPREDRDVYCVIDIFQVVEKHTSGEYEKL